MCVGVGGWQGVGWLAETGSSWQLNVCVSMQLVLVRACMAVVSVLD